MAKVSAEQITAAMEAMAGEGQAITVRALTVADEDHLALHLQGSRLHEHGLHDLATKSDEHIRIDIERDAENGAIVMLTRRCAMSTSIN